MSGQQELNLWGEPTDLRAGAFLTAFDGERASLGNNEEALLPLCSCIAHCLAPGGSSAPEETIDYIARLALAIKAALPPAMGDLSGFAGTYDVLRDAAAQAIRTGDGLAPCAGTLVSKLRNPFEKDAGRSFEFWL